MDFRAILGISRKCRDDGRKFGYKRVIIPQNSEMFDENELVVIIKAKDFKEIANDLQRLISVMDSARECEEHSLKID